MCVSFQFIFWAVQTLLASAGWRLDSFTSFPFEPSPCVHPQKKKKTSAPSPSHPRRPSLSCPKKKERRRQHTPTPKLTRIISPSHPRKLTCPHSPFAPRDEQEGQSASGAVKGEGGQSVRRRASQLPERHSWLRPTCFDADSPNLPKTRRSVELSSCPLALKTEPRQLRYWFSAFLALVGGLSLPLAHVV